MPLWTIPRDWCGETAIIIGGGPSAADVSPELLRGRKVVVVNSSYERFPFADLLVFGDRRWWLHHQDQLRAFGGQIATTVANIPDHRVLTLNNSRPDKGILGRSKSVSPLALSLDPTAVPCRWTSMVPAMNIAVLRGARTLITLGLDGKPAANGKTHHHRPHPAHFGSPTSARWEIQRNDDFVGFARSLAAHGITVINASPGSAVDLWPVMSLREALARVESRSHDQAAQPCRDPSGCGAAHGAGSALA